MLKNVQPCIFILSCLLFNCTYSFSTKHIVGLLKFSYLASQAKDLKILTPKSTILFELFLI